MKKWMFFAWIFLWSGVVGNAQQFTKVFDDGTSNVITDIDELPNGNLLMVTRNALTTLFEIAPSGDTVWTNKFEYAGYHTRFDKVAHMNNGKFVNAGYARYTNRAAFTIRDTHGVVLADTFLRPTYSGVPLVFAHDVITDDDDNIYFVGRLYDIFSGGVSFYSWTKPLIGKLDSNLEVQWIRKFSTHTYSNRRTGSAVSLALTPDDNLVVYGIHSYGGSNSSNTARNYLTKIQKSNGASLWARQLHSTASGVKKVCVNSHGDVYTMKQLYSSQISGYNTNVAQLDKFSAGGDHLWTRIINHPSYSLTAGDMDINVNDEIIIGGQLYISSTERHASVIRLDSAGEFLNASIIDVDSVNGGQSSISVVKALQNNQIALGARFGSDPLLIRTDAYGFLNCSTDSTTYDSDTVTFNWETGVNTGSYSLSYENEYNYYYDEMAPSLSFDTLCFVSPGCDAVSAFTVNDSVLCAEETLSLTSQAYGTGISVQWQIDSSLASGNSFDTTLGHGVYTVTQYVNGAYCNDTSSISVSIKSLYDDSIDVFLCVGDSQSIAGEWYTSDTSVTDSLFSVFGCDSVVHYSLIFQQSFGFIADTICSNEHLVFGAETLSLSGVYYDTLIAASGCDSILELTLVVLSTSFSSFNDTICDGQAYAFGSQSLQVSGTYYDTLIAVNGCDSVSELVLEVLSTSFTSIADSVCASDSVLFGSVYYAQSGTYYDTLTKQNGCDSVIELTLTSLSEPFTAIFDTICELDSFAFGSTHLNAAGVYYDTLSTILGCDSIIELNLHVKSLSYAFVEDSVCQDDSLLFGAVWRVAPGVYYDTLVSSNNCDSIVELTFSWIAEVETILYDTICEGYSIVFGGQVLDEPGVFYDTLSTIFGCDSVIEMNLAELENSESYMYQEICEGDTVYFDGQPIYSTGLYVQGYTSSNGCDSTASFEVVVRQHSNGNSDKILCQGSSVMYNGQSITIPGIYLDTFQNQYGCDSVHALELIAAEIESKVGIFGDTLRAILPAELYEWIYCETETPTGNYTNFMVPTNELFYALVAYDSNGCTDTSECFMIEQVIGIKESNASMFQVFPNPSAGIVTVTAATTMSLDVFDAQGNLIQRHSLETGSNQLDLGRLSQGTYFLKGRMDGSAQYQSIIVLD